MTRDSVYSPWTKEAAGLQSYGGPDVLLAGVVLHHDGQTLLMGLLLEHGSAALGVAGDGEGVGDVVADELAPHGSEASEVLVRGAPLLQNSRRHKQGVGKLTGHSENSGASHTWNRIVLGVLRDPLKPDVIPGQA